MGVSYRPLWVELAKRDMKKIKFQELTGISSNLLANMGKNEYISMKNLELICRTMNLSPNEVIEFKDE
ncbi:DNA-binding transcriptional regulator, XRE family [Anaerosphaera aminiphila DSM 21120]|mgnify:FL=1|jgi:DNA-binding Xre family transcriptional regulator|uniref:DNA-binding transcriptional regulator, XRE family n=1 Tax=Anaerosphaera aminiphila DSM 21120 TaxID=1120995 RepID=A0A1M5SFY4_9FIRM|nr:MULTISPECIES: helix-turn-helix transcriptional regulator [Bacillota]SHH37375.1 DNA-binding transcriptional regulator, XRE family [Anaerosphaera aminiphila DSM 21120]HBN28274.1 XRE family transcriptional regulator [Clostridiaceae bacterium]